MQVKTTSPKRINVNPKKQPKASVMKTKAVISKPTNSYHKNTPPTQSNSAVFTRSSAIADSNSKKIEVSTPTISCKKQLTSLKRQAPVKQKLNTVDPDIEKMNADRKKTLPTQPTIIKGRRKMESANSDHEGEQPSRKRSRKTSTSVFYNFK